MQCFSNKLNLRPVGSYSFLFFTMNPLISLLTKSSKCCSTSRSLHDKYTRRLVMSISPPVRYRSISSISIIRMPFTSKSRPFSPQSSFIFGNCSDSSNFLTVYAIVTPYPLQNQYNIISVMLYSVSINLFYPISASHSFPQKENFKQYK